MSVEAGVETRMYRLNSKITVYVYYKKYITLIAKSLSLYSFDPAMDLVLFIQICDPKSHGHPRNLWFDIPPLGEQRNGKSHPSQRDRQGKGQFQSVHVSKHDAGDLLW